MKRPDSTFFRLFYRSHMGKFVARQLQHSLSLWSQKASNEAELTTLALGYPFPLMPQPLPKKTRMVVPWKMKEEHIPKTYLDYTDQLAEELALPYGEQTVANIISYHGLEYAIRPQLLLAEMWRVLEPNGQLLLLIPNRNSRWSRKASTPFGHGMPYSHDQIAELLEDQGFTINKQSYELPLPPRHARSIVRFQAWLLNLLQNKLHLPCPSHWPCVGGGLLRIEAEKRLYSVTPQPFKRTFWQFKTATAASTMGQSRSSKS